jgi:hypothetical protein
MEGMQAYFDGSGSRDQTSGVVAYRFIFGDGEESGWTSSPVAWHSYRTAGTYKSSLTVRDASGRESAQAGLEVTVMAVATSGPAPVPSKPSSGLTTIAVAAAVVLVLFVGLAAWYLRTGSRPDRTRPRQAVGRQRVVEWDEDILKRPEGLQKGRRGGA